MKKVLLLVGLTVVLWSFGGSVSAVTFEEALGEQKGTCLFGSEIRFTQQDTICFFMASMYPSLVYNKAYGRDTKNVEKLFQIRRTFLVETAKKEIQDEKRFDSLDHLIFWVEGMFGRSKILGKTVSFSYPDQASAFIPVLADLKDVLIFAKNHFLASPEFKKESEKRISRIDFVVGKLNRNFDAYYDELMKGVERAKKK